MKVGGPIGGADSSVGLTSSPQLDTGGIEVSILSGESLLKPREKVRRSTEGVYQEYTGVKVIPFERGCSINMSRHALMCRPAAILETMVVVKQTYVLV